MFLKFLSQPRGNLVSKIAYFFLLSCDGKKAIAKVAGYNHSHRVRGRGREPRNRFGDPNRGTGTRWVDVPFMDGSRPSRGSRRTSCPKKFVAPRGSGGVGAGGDGEPSSRSSPALVPPCVTAGAVPPSHPTRIVGPRASLCRSQRSPTQPRAWRMDDYEIIRREEVTGGSCFVTVR
jgi:hypothetical protein